MKTTACFNENDGSFFLPFNEGGKKETGEDEIAKETLIAPLRARVCTHNRSFCIFAVTSVTDVL